MYSIYSGRMGDPRTHKNSFLPIPVPYYPYSGLGLCVLEFQSLNRSPLASTLRLSYLVPYNLVFSERNNVIVSAVQGRNVASASSIRCWIGKAFSGLGEKCHIWQTSLAWHLWLNRTENGFSAFQCYLPCKVGPSPLGGFKSCRCFAFGAVQATPIC